jgi:Spy/CpxP family protein refolding chaperone
MSASSWLAVTLILVLAFPGSSFAQSPGGYGPPGAGGYGPSGGGMRPRSGGGGFMGHGGGEHRMPSPSELEGPPSPAVMRDSISLDANQVQEYSKRYADHMASTRTERDSLRTAVQAARTAFESGDRAAARERGQSIGQQWKDLSDQDKAFDKGLKDILTKDQQKRYQKWKDDREKAERDQWRRQRVPDANGQDRSLQI